jgi:hypothetical protein
MRVRGIVGAPKTQESIASLPLFERVIVPLELWRRKSPDTSGWLFPSVNNTPIDLHNLVARVISPDDRGRGSSVEESVCRTPRSRDRDHCSHERQRRHKTNFTPSQEYEHHADVLQKADSRRGSPRRGETVGEGMTASKCTSRPDCRCAFCVMISTEPSSRDEERQLAEAYIVAFQWHRDREMDREALAAGTFGKFPGELVMDSPAT